MASISFLAGGYGFGISNLNNSGLGFFGAGGFGQSVAVNAWQGTTWITDGNGINMGPQVNNVQYVHPNSGAVQGGTIVNLQNIPNYQSTLNIRFNNSTPVRTQNGKVYIYDRVSTSNDPSGVTCMCAAVIHPDTVQNANGSGTLVWQWTHGTGYIDMSHLNNGTAFSPGTSGQGINGGATTDTQHDFYLNISASPNSIGSKTYFGLLASVEYLRKPRSLDNLEYQLI